MAQMLAIWSLLSLYITVNVCLITTPCVRSCCGAVGGGGYNDSVVAYVATPEEHLAVWHEHNWL
jgi:hypothetical protein